MDKPDLEDKIRSLNDLIRSLNDLIRSLNDLIRSLNDLIRSLRSEINERKELSRASTQVIKELSRASIQVIKELQSDNKRYCLMIIEQHAKLMEFDRKVSKLKDEKEYLLKINKARLEGLIDRDKKIARLS